MPGGEMFTLAGRAVRTLRWTRPEERYREPPNGDPFVTLWNNVIQDGLSLLENLPTHGGVWLFFADADPGCG